MAANPIRDIEALEAKLASQLAKANRQRSTTIIFGVLLVAFMLGYFTWITNFVADALKPDQVAMMLSTKIQSEIPGMRKTLEGQAEKAIPEVVNTLVDGVVKKQLPEYRIQVEGELKKEALVYLDQTETKIVAAFDEVMKAHGDNIRERVKDLSTEEGRVRMQEDLYSTLDEAVKGTDIQIELQSYDIALEQIVGMLKFLADPANELTDDEKLIAEMVATLREIGNRTDFATQLPALLPK